MNNNCYRGSRAAFVRPDSRWHKSVGFAVAGLISFGVVLAKKLNKNAKEKHRKY